MSINAPEPGTSVYASLVTPHIPASGFGTSGIRSSPEYPIMEPSSNSPTTAEAIDNTFTVAIVMSQVYFFF